jgi:hypothetical protein
LPVAAISSRPVVAPAVATNASSTSASTRKSRPGMNWAMMKAATARIVPIISSAVQMSPIHLAFFFTQSLTASHASSQAFLK